VEDAADLPGVFLCGYDSFKLRGGIPPNAEQHLRLQPVNDPGKLWITSIRNRRALRGSQDSGREIRS
jgi:hypothetical protein